MGFNLLLSGLFGMPIPSHSDDDSYYIAGTMEDENIEEDELYNLWKNSKSDLSFRQWRRDYYRSSILFW